MKFQVVLISSLYRELHTLTALTTEEILANGHEEKRVPEEEYCLLGHNAV
jgi:hypothetical protein